MVAYSYKRRFVNPIRIGLGLPILPEYEESERVPRPKRQTIRADRRRHARPGEIIQHYRGMRTRQCFKIGEGRCVRITPIRIVVNEHTMPTALDGVHVGEGRLHDFARADGFDNAEDMHAFWKEEHGLGEFRGVLIQWEPLP